MQSHITKTHRLSNREKLQDAARLLEDVQSDPAISASPFSMLDTALSNIRDAAQHPLNAAELHEIRVAAIAEAVTDASHL